MTLPQVKPSKSLSEFVEQIKAIAQLAEVTGMFVAIELEHGEHITTHQFGLGDDSLTKIAKLAEQYQAMDSLRPQASR